jgi:hypothetical protein
MQNAEKKFSAAGIKQAEKPCVKRFPSTWKLMNTLIQTKSDIHLWARTKTKKRSEERL